MDLRSINEIKHGRLLAAHNTEFLWGWDTPAGRIRAKRRAQFIASGARLGPNVSVLEIGCGTGLFTEMFAKTKARLTAVDISEDLLRKARERGLPLNQVKFVTKRFEDCDVDASFDAIIGSSILHHLDPGDAFSRIYKLLKPGGIMSFAEPNLLNPFVFIMKNFSEWFPSESPDETAFFHKKLKRELKKRGFENINITPFDWLYPFTPKPMIKFVCLLGTLMEKTPILKNFSGSLYICARRPANG